MKAVRARFVLVALLASCAVAQAQGQAPTIDQLISLKRAGSPAISPNGQWVAYTVRDTNWDDNAYHTEIWLADAKSGELRQLTNHAKKSSTSPAWSPDSTKLAFATDRDEKRQIYVIDPRGGEARKLTSVEDGVGSFAWAPDGKSFAFTSTEPKTDADKEREKKFGEFDVIGEGYRMSHLWVFDLATQKARRLTSGAFTVGQFSWSPDGTQIAFDHRVNSASTSGATADISIVSVADGKVRPLVTQAGADAGPVWSPDGSKIAFESAMTKPFSFLNNAIGRHPGGGRRDREPHRRLRREPLDRPTGLRRGCSSARRNRTWAFLYSIDPATKAVKKYAPSEQWIGSGFSLTPDGQWAAFIAADASTLGEMSHVAPWAPSARSKPARKLTDMTAQTAAWAKSALEVVSWKSQDGATIEGVLHKPIGFQAGKKYPLLVVIHGGPTGISRPTAYLQHVHLSDRHLDREGGARPRAELPRQRRLRRGVPIAQRPQPRRRRRVGRPLGHRPSDQGRPRRSQPGGDDGVEPGRIHLGLPHDARQRAVQGGVGRRRDLRLDDLLRQHRHHAVHAALPEGDALGRSGDLREDLADHLHQERQGADADPARRRPTSACRRPTPSSSIAACRTSASRRS